MIILNLPHSLFTTCQCLMPLQYPNVSTFFYSFSPCPFVSSFPWISAAKYNDDDDNERCNVKNMTPTFALIYVEHADSLGVAKHTGLSEKRKHRRPEDSHHQVPLLHPEPPNLFYSLFPRGSYF